MNKSKGFTARRRFIGALAAASASLATPPVFAKSPASSGAAESVRSLRFHNLHTGEDLKADYWVEGQYQKNILAEINRILRFDDIGDWLGEQLVPEVLHVELPSERHHGWRYIDFGPDGKLYMSKGNSKGLTKPGRLAPKPFRDLWDVESPPGAPDFPPIEVFMREDYRKNFHHPADDWGKQGGILRCDDMGANLEIVSEGFRNPWDITFDDGFDWLGTDNDQTLGDKIFAPFYGAHFGWGHSWSYHWSGQGHLPSVPASAPLFEGSGAGIIHYHAGHFPEEYRNVCFINDWMRREVYLFRPQRDGALLEHVRQSA